MKNNLKVAIFDFCETIANFQTGDAYIFFVLSKSNRIFTKYRSIVYVWLQKLRIIYYMERLFPMSSINKRLVLWQIKGETTDFLEKCAKEYYDTSVKVNLIQQTITILLSHIAQGDKVIVVSAGYEIYLKYFMADFNLSQDNLISVKIGFAGNKCTGRFDGGDRLYDKTQKLNQLLNKNCIYSIAYSDSPSDLPMLEWANEAYVVRRYDKSKWNHKYPEIIWE